VFAYYVRIENIGTLPAQLLSRRWLIHDEIGGGGENENENTEVEGAGVVGEQPVITPGQVHEYQSFCILKSGEGYMEGTYGFLRADGVTFDAEIPRFTLSVTETPSLPPS
jgi:ApaG protein